MLFQSLEEEEAEALRQEALNGRAATTAASFTPSMFRNLEANVARNPTLPPDAQLALAVAPISTSMFDNIGVQYASQPRQAQVGDRITPLQAQRYLSATPEQQALVESTLQTAEQRIASGPQSRLRRFFGGVSNALDGPAGLAQSALQAVPGSGAAYTGLKGAVRYGSPVLDSGQQMIQTRGRSAVAGVSALAGGAFMEADAHFRQASARHFTQPDVEQTDIGQLGIETGRLVQQVATGQERTAFSDFGSGFFINEESDLVRRRREAERVPGTIPLTVAQASRNELLRSQGVEILPGGQTITIGRGLAHFAGLTPESTSYNVLSGIADGILAVSAPGPEAGLAQQLRRVRAPGARLFGGVSEQEYMSSIGGFRGVRTQVNLGQARDFIQSDRATRFVDFLSENTSWSRIDEATNGALDPATVSALADASDGSRVRELLVQAVEHGERPSLQGATSRTRHAIGRELATGGRLGRVRRLSGEMPNRTIDLRDGRGSVDTIRDYAMNVNVRGDMADEWVEAMGRASNNVERRDVYSRILGDTAEHLSGVSDTDFDALRLAARGTPDGSDARNALRAAESARERARELTKYARNELDTTRAALDDMMEMDVSDWSKGLVETEYGTRIPGAELIAEMAEELPLPDSRELRRADGFLRSIWEIGEGSDAHILKRVLGKGWRSSAIALSGFNRIFKDTRLARLGYLLRVVPEEQLRRFADGSNALVSHPFGVLGALMDPRVNQADEMASGWRRLLSTADDIPSPLAINRIADQAAPPRQLRNIGTNTGVRQLATGEALTDDDLFRAAMADSRLGGLRENGLTGPSRGKLERFVMRDEFGEIHDDALTVWRDNLATLASDPVISRVARNGIDDTMAEMATTSVGREIREKLVAFDHRLADDMELRKYLESVSRRIEAMTGGNEDLLSHLVNGRKPLQSDLRDIADEFAPEAVIGRGLVPTDKDSLYTRGTNQMFEWLATRPTNRFSRSPVFLERYEQNLIELAPLAANSDEFLAAARKANVRESTMEILQRTAVGEGSLQINAIDAMARKGALDHVQDLLYDVGKNSQFFDQYRLLFPFGEAWKEVITTWAKLFSNDPFTITRRAGQAMETLGSNDFGQTYFDLAGLDQQSDTGFFYENDFGDQVFYYPWSSQIMEKLTGVGTETGMPWRLEGGARNLNLAGELLPGLGPVGQVAMSRLIPNKTDYDALRAKLFPFGPPEDPRNVASWALPNWLETMALGSNGFTQDQERLFGNTQWRVANYLYSRDPERYQGVNGAQLLEDDARPITRNVYLTRGMGQALAPASPLISATMVGPNGELIDQAVVADAYRALQAEDYNTALEQLIFLYGEGSVLATQGNTVATVHGGTPFDGAGYDWVRDNPDVSTDHPELFGFFAPSGEGSDFSSEAYRRSLDTGERVQLTFKQKFKLAQHRQASAIYRANRAAVDGEPNAEQRAILNQLRQELRERFPGYQRIDDVVTKTDVWRVVEAGDVDRALEDPTITATPAGQALAEYWAIREEVVIAAENAGLATIGDGGWRSANAGQPYRDILRRAGEGIVAREPELARMWDVFLSQEFDEDLEN